MAYRRKPLILPIYSDFPNRFYAKVLIIKSFYCSKSPAALIQRLSESLTYLVKFGKLLRIKLLLNFVPYPKSISLKFLLKFSTILIHCLTLRRKICCYFLKTYSEGCIFSQNRIFWPYPLQKSYYFPQVQWKFSLIPRFPPLTSYICVICTPAYSSISGFKPWIGRRLGCWQIRFLNGKNN